MTAQHSVCEYLKQQGAISSIRRVSVIKTAGSAYGYNFFLWVPLKNSSGIQAKAFFLDSRRKKRGLLDVNKAFCNEEAGEKVGLETELYFLEVPL